MLRSLAPRCLPRSLPLTRGVVVCRPLAAFNPVRAFAAGPRNNAGPPAPRGGNNNNRRNAPPPVEVYSDTSSSETSSSETSTTDSEFDEEHDHDYTDEEFELDTIQLKGAFFAAACAHCVSSHAVQVCRSTPSTVCTRRRRRKARRSSSMLKSTLTRAWLVRRISPACSLFACSGESDDIKDTIDYTDLYKASFS